MRFIIGKARSGKTAAVIREIQEAVARGEGRMLLIVPEQYSHEAERELCEACGDRMSLYAEVMSFTGLARWMQSRFGGGSRTRIDRGGKLLCVSKALRELKPVLRRYAAAAENTDQQLLFLQELEMLQTSGADSLRLRELAKETGSVLSEKLSEIATVFEGYRAVMGRADVCSQEMLEQLAQQIRRFGLPGVRQVYVDGFIDFTGLEHKVLEALIRCGIDLTVCLPGDREDDRAEYFLPSRTAQRQLTAFCEEAGIRVVEKVISREEDPSPLRIFTDNMFRFDAQRKPLKGEEILLLRPQNPMEECEAAAGQILRAVREDGCRWRDIAVAVRGFEDYRPVLESCLRRYGIPYFRTGRDTLTDKSFPIWLESAYDVILGNWDTEDVISWLRCGMSGLEEDALDELCAYLRRWRLRGSAWTGTEDWRQHPEGYGQEFTEGTLRKLRRLNRSRRWVAKPLLQLAADAEQASNGLEHARALAAFLKNTRAASMLDRRAEKLDADGMQELRAEYLQLWELCSKAIEQIAAILGDVEMDTAQFREMLHAVLAQTDVGLIPISLDRVPIGDFDRMRRRNIRRLIVLGCGDERMPRARSEKGIFSQDERDILAEHELSVGGGEGELWREYALIYHTLSLPHERLILSCPELNASGEKCMPAFVYRQAEKIFSLKPEHVRLPEIRLMAEMPAFALALQADSPWAGAEERAAAAWARSRQPERFERIRSAVRTERGSLSPRAVESLYGRQLRISPSRLETFSDCQFAYYCRYGLNAKQEEPAEYGAQVIGSFIHRVLEQVAREVKELGGFAAVTHEQLREMTEEAISRYVHEELGDFAEKSARFRHLFRRLCEDVFRIVEDSAEELRRSDFEPLSFELDISRISPEFPLSDGSLRMTGIADRVDGWLHDGLIDLRVVDYKTGKKEFRLSDVLYGRDLQMLLYLFAVCDRSEELFGMPGRPAGVVYLPARDPRPTFDRAPEDGQVEQERQKARRRSGLVLNEGGIPEAWERDPDQIYIPVRSKALNPLISREQLGLLRRNAEQTLVGMGEELKKGSIRANPVWQSARDNACVTCEYASVCGFSEGEHGERSRRQPELKEEEAWELLRARAAGEQPSEREAPEEVTAVPETSGEADRREEKTGAGEEAEHK